MTSPRVLSINKTTLLQQQRFVVKLNIAENTVPETILYMNVKTRYYTVVKTKMSNSIIRPIVCTSPKINEISNILVYELGWLFVVSIFHTTYIIICRSSQKFCDLFKTRRLNRIESWLLLFTGLTRPLLLYRYNNICIMAADVCRLRILKPRYRRGG